MMRFQFHKYWRDLLMPVLRQDRPPTIPQAIVLQDQQVLLVQRDNPRFWELPGGGMVPGETPEATVVREVQEETGVQVEIIELLGWYERTGFRAHLSPVYVCRPQSGPPQAHDTDTVQVRYFPLHRLPRGLCPWYRSILQRDLPSPHPRPLRQYPTPGAPDGGTLYRARPRQSARSVQLTYSHGQSPMGL